MAKKAGDCRWLWLKVIVQKSCWCVGDFLGFSTVFHASLCSQIIHGSMVVYCMGLCWSCRTFSTLTLIDCRVNWEVSNFQFGPISHTTLKLLVYGLGTMERELLRNFIQHGRLLRSNMQYGRRTEWAQSVDRKTGVPKRGRNPENVFFYLPCVCQQLAVRD